MIPLPNHEWVISWTTTSTRLLSPVISAADRVSGVNGEVLFQSLTWRDECQACVFLLLAHERAMPTRSQSHTYHASVRKRGRQHQQVVHPKLVWDRHFFLRCQEPSAGACRQETMTRRDLDSNSPGCVCMELVPRRVNELRFSPQPARPRLALGHLERAIDHVPGSKGQQVRWDRDGLHHDIHVCTTCSPTLDIRWHLGRTGDVPDCTRTSPMSCPTHRRLGSLLPAGQSGSQT